MEFSFTVFVIPPGASCLRSQEGKAAGEVARMFKVHRATLYRALNTILPPVGSAAGVAAMIRSSERGHIE
jgi:hypothetical protein